MRACGGDWRGSDLSEGANGLMRVSPPIIPERDPGVVEEGEREREVIVIDGRNRHESL